MAVTVEIKGTYTAVVTPFDAAAEGIDFEALERLVEEQIAGGVAGLVPCGTTGEAPTLTDQEQVEVIGRVVKIAAGRVPIVAGAGSNSTAKSIKASKAALDAGADGVMIVAPYYNKPSQRGIQEHVWAVARSVDCPIIFYNIPGRSVVDLTAEATEELCEKAPNVVAVKDATGNVIRCQELKRRLGDRLTVMCGDDGLTLPMMAAGASGVISVSSNVIPAKIANITKLIEQGDLRAARAAHFELLPMHGVMFAEPNPAPVKAALSQLGKMKPSVRLPLVAASEDVCKRIATVLTNLGIQ